MMAEQQTDEVAERELSEFERAIIDIRSKPLSQYCEEDISQIKCELGVIKCGLNKAREKISQSVHCVGYNWDLKRKPALVSGFNSFLSSLEAEIQKMEESLKKRESELQNQRSSLEQKYANKYISGWEPDGYKE